MPQPLPGDKSVISGPNTILERPDLAALAANVCASWALVENDVMVLYGLLLGTYLPDYTLLAGSYEPPAHPVAYQIFTSMYNFQQKMSLLNQLCKWIATEGEYEDYERITKGCTARSNDRNLVAHGQWGVCADYPDALILMRVYGGYQIWKARDFRASANRILELHADIGQFIARIYQRLKLAR